MLLALDVGNSNTVIGLFRPASEGSTATLVADWRITTPYDQTPDELGVLLGTLFSMRGLATDLVTGVAVSSVVPPLDAGLRKLCETYFKVRPLFIEPGVKTGLPVLTDNPSEVGADRVVNCVAAYDLVGGPAVVVDMGTATTFDVVSRKGEFLGGAIAPGLGISADALFARAAKLTRVEIKKPVKIIGTSTTDNIQIGLYYGYIGLIDGILERMIAELGPDTKVIGTGGLAKLIAKDCKYLHQVDDMLTLNGLRLIWERNQERHRRK
ncbi:MAG: type III pantothenate kinase [Acidobacteriaceae bacterium]|nr:type III pantothenate kinase [Acidobacteriaceae bacterium]